MSAAADYAPAPKSYLIGESIRVKLKKTTTTFGEYNGTVVGLIVSLKDPRYTDSRYCGGQGDLGKTKYVIAADNYDDATDLLTNARAEAGIVKSAEIVKMIGGRRKTRRSRSRRNQTRHSRK